MDLNTHLTFSPFQKRSVPVLNSQWSQPGSNLQFHAHNQYLKNIDFKRRLAINRPLGGGGTGAGGGRRRR